MFRKNIFQLLTYALFGSDDIYCMKYSEILQKEKTYVRLQGQAFENED